MNLKTLLSALTVLAAFASFAEIVSKDIGDPTMNEWKAGDWVTAPGDALAIDEAPVADPQSKTLRLEVRYPARAFGGWNCTLKNNVLPGKPEKLTGWARLGNEKSWGMSFEFEDANTNKFNLDMKVPGDPKAKFDLNTTWKEFEMTFPKEVNGKGPDGKNCKLPIRYPVKFLQIGGHNWGDRNNPNAVTRQLDLYDFRLLTDMEGVAEAERPFDFLVGYPVIGNTFYYGEDKPQVRFAANSWIGKELEIQLEAKVVDQYGNETKMDIPKFKFLDSSSATFDLPCTEPGGYSVIVTAKGFPKEIVSKSRYVVVLKPKTLTDAEKEISPYGINVHGGGYVGYEKFSRLGFTWVRDYAYTWGWMLRARGDGKYAGWPWYPKILKGAEDAGLKTLPCLMGAVNFKTPVAEADLGKQKPDNEWRRQLALICSTFPTLTAWELDNECDPKLWSDLNAYGSYCQAFGDIVKACRPDAKSVSPGLAGIFVGATKVLVDNGYFRNIDVVNGHRYCGKDAPEYSKGNANTGMSEAKKEYLRDCFRNWKRAACGDGKFRELWVTEWGWDTLAGQPVSELEQAAYLPRKWLIGMGNGIEKMFWYWYYDDDTDKPTYFFAGCGIFDRKRNPKPSAAAFAALAHFVPLCEKYLGTANLDANHMVQIVKAQGKIVALAYKIRKDGPDLEIADEKCEGVYNLFGRKLERSGKRKLGIDGTWYVGLDPESTWLKQAAMDLDSDFYVRAVGGEPVRIKPIAMDKYNYTVQPPKGWTATKTADGFDVTGPAGLGRDTIKFTVTGENGGVKKVMPIDVDIVPQAYTLTKAADFEGNFKIDVVNQSASEQDFLVKSVLPEGWKVEPAETHTGKMKPEERKSLSFKLVKSADVSPSEKVNTPKFEVVNANGLKVDTAPVIPRTWTMQKLVKKISFDGDLADWDERYLMNPFMIGPNGDKDPSKIYFAWSEEGLYAALDIDDSKCFVADPGSFWRAADCFEVMVTTPPGVAFKADAPWSINDHQLWFCPIAEKKHVFTGYWPNIGEQNKYQDAINARVKGTKQHGEWSGSADGADMPDCKSCVVKTARGYRAEMFVPAERLNGWDQVKDNAEIGLAFMLTVMDLKDSQHNLYWPNPKADNNMKKPWLWARVKLSGK